MSVKIFKPGSEVGNPQQKGARYKPGSLTYDQKLIPKLIRHCYPDALGSTICTSLPDDFADIITTHAQEDFDPLQFLDAVVAEAGKSRGSSSSSFLDDFLTPVVQALYSLGYNSFNLDLSPCETGGGIITLATSLKGKPGNLLEVRYQGISPHMLGNYNEFCKLSLDGSAESVGLESEWSEFTVTKRVPLSVLGEAGSNCVFSIGEPDPCELMFHGYLDYDTDDVFEPVLTYIKNKGFFERNNTLYFPDSQGGWKEVAPP